MKEVNISYRPIGDIFEHEGEMLRVVKSNGCVGCAFMSSPCSETNCCGSRGRKDGEFVIYALIKDYTPKNGEYIYTKGRNYSAISIAKGGEQKAMGYAHVIVEDHELWQLGLFAKNENIKEIRPATSQERRMFNEVLAKHGKGWDASTLSVIPKYEPKDGEYFTTIGVKGEKITGIFKSFGGSGLIRCYALIGTTGELHIDESCGFLVDDIIRPATNEERGALNNELTKTYKFWDADKKEILSTIYNPSNGDYFALVTNWMPRPILAISNGIVRREDGGLGAHIHIDFDGRAHLRQSFGYQYGDKLRPATQEEIGKIDSALKAEGLVWSPEKKELCDLPKFKVGDWFIPHKPNNKNQDPKWVSSMNAFDGKAMKVREIDDNGYLLADKGWTYNADWCAKLQDPNQEPKDGEYFYVEEEGGFRFIAIKQDGGVRTRRYVSFSLLTRSFHKDSDGNCTIDENIVVLRKATQEEINVFNSALEAEGLIWDAKDKVLKPITEVGKAYMLHDGEISMAIISVVRKVVQENDYVIGYQSANGILYKFANPIDSINSYLGKVK